MTGPFGIGAGIELDEGVIAQFETLQNAIRAIRNMRRELNLGPREKVRVVIRCQNGGLKELFESQSGLISNQKFGGLEALEIIAHEDKAPGRCLYTAFEEFEAFLPISDEEKLKAEIARQEKELAKAEKFQMQVDKKLSSEKFVSGAPAEVVARERDKAAENKAIIEKVSERLKMLTS